MSWDDWEAYFDWQRSGGYLDHEEAVIPKKKRSKNKSLYLVDGDNNVYERLKGINNADETDDIRVYVSQDGLYDKLKKKAYPHVTVVKVDPGPQAVDNRIKSVMGSALKSGKHDKVFVLSGDTGYDNLINRNRCRYRKKKDKLDRREIFCEED